MRILIPCSSYGRVFRGVEIWARNISKEFVKMGFEVYIICGQNSTSKEGKINLLKFPIINRESLVYKQRPFEEISSLIESASLSISSFSFIKNFDFDVMLSCQWSDLYLSLFLKKVKKFKQIFCFQSTPRKLTKLLYIPIVFGSTDKFVSISEFVRKGVKETFGIDSLTIYNGVDTKLFKPLKTRKEKKIVFLYVGALLRKKGIYTLIDAIKSLDQDKFKLLIAGSGPEESKIKNLIITNKITNIKFLGTIAHNMLPKIYNSSDIVVIPSEYPEAFGIVAAEAMACGKPIIASNIGGLGEIVRESKSGLLFYPGNKKELIEKMLSLSFDRKVRENFGNNGREFAERELDWSKIAEKYLQLIVD